MNNLTTEYLKNALAQAYAALCDKCVCDHGNTISITLPLKHYPARFLVIHELLINDGYKSVLTTLLADFDLQTARTLVASLMVLNENFIAGTPCFIFDDNKTYTRRHVLCIQIYGEPLRNACSRLHSAILHGADFSEYDIREFEQIRLELSQIFSTTPISEPNPLQIAGNGL